jgi:tyrosine-protein kinase Etk/Wzc
MAEDDLVYKPSKPKVSSPQERSPFKAKPLSDAVASRTGHSNQNYEISFLDILIVLAKHKKVILGLPFLAAVLAAGITLLMPNWYTATAKLLPPQQSQSNAIAILGQLGALSGGASSALGLKNPSDIFVAMLKSRTVADALIERFKLKDIYDEKYLQNARKKLAKRADITASREGVITIEVEDRSPSRAADIANAYIEELEKLTRSLAVGEAGQRRLFFEQQLNKAKTDLTNAEHALAQFQIDKKILNPQGQASLTISAAAGLQAQIAAKEVQIASLSSFATQENPDLHRAKEELSGLRSALAKVARGKSDDIGDVLISIGKAPEQALEYLRKFRDVKYYETLFELLAKQYEIARIDEAKEATLIQVLDIAIPPEIRSSPKRALIVVLIAIGSAFLLMIWATCRNWIERAKKDPLQESRLRELRKHIKLSTLP